MGKEKNDDQYYLESMKCFDDLIDNNSIDNKYRMRAFKNKGNVLSLMGKYSEAKDCYDKAIALYPPYAAAFTNKGNAHFGLGEYAEAIKNYDKALKILDRGLGEEITNINELKSTTYNHRGLAKYNLGNFSGALEDFLKMEDGKMASDLKARKYNNIGACHYNQKSYDKAKDFFRKSIDYDWNLVYAHYNLAVLFNKENNREEAIIELNNCLKVNKDFKNASLALNKMEYSGRVDWYNWWFKQGLGKKMLGGTLLALVVVLVVGIAYISTTNNSISTNSLAGLGLAAGITGAILLLPSLKKVKLGSYVELEMIAAPA